MSAASSSESGLQSHPWQLDTKYYTADVELCVESGAAQPPEARTEEQLSALFDGVNVGPRVSMRAQRRMLLHWRRLCVLLDMSG